MAAPLEVVKKSKYVRSGASILACIKEYGTKSATAGTMNDVRGARASVSASREACREADYRANSDFFAILVGLSRRKNRRAA